MTTFGNETCLNVKHQCFIFEHIIQIYLNTYPIYKQISECLLQKVMLAAVQVTDEQLIAPLYLMQISANCHSKSAFKCITSAASQIKTDKHTDSHSVYLL